MKPKTIRIRRSRPSALSLALALMLTMLFVYLISLSASPDADDGSAVAAQAPGSADVRMEGLSAAFLCKTQCDNLLEARVAAANCAQEGGAGLILAEGGQYAVIRAALPADDAPEGALVRSGDGLTLKLSGPGGEIRAVSDTIDFLRAQAVETGSLAGALEQGDTDAASIAALLDVYRTRGRRALSQLREIQTPGPIVERLERAAASAVERLDAAREAPDAGKVRLIHAAACAEWISLLTDLPAGGDAPLT